ncbi:hypothetical protein BDA99DRAFT_502062, partial [Phascolomyces articulosus]
MTDRPSLSQLCGSSSYTSLASQATLTEDTTIPSSKTSEDDGEDPPSRPETSSFGDDDTSPTTPTVYNTYNINSIARQSVEEQRQQQAPLPTSSSATTTTTTTSANINRSSNYSGSNMGGMIYNTSHTMTETSATETTPVPTDIFNSTIEKMTIPIRNNLPIAAAVETKVMGAHHHRHRSLVHHYSPMAYLPIHRPNNKKEELEQDDDGEKKSTAVFATLPSSIPISPPTTATATATTTNDRCSISSTAIGEEDALELLRQQQHISTTKKEKIIVLL